MAAAPVRLGARERGVVGGGAGPRQASAFKPRLPGSFGGWACWFRLLTPLFLRPHLAPPRSPFLEPR